MLREWVYNYKSSFDILRQRTKSAIRVQINLDPKMIAVIERAQIKKNKDKSDKDDKWIGSASCACVLQLPWRWDYASPTRHRLHLPGGGGGEWREPLSWLDPAKTKRCGLKPRPSITDTLSATMIVTLISWCTVYIVSCVRYFKTLYPFE